MRLVLRVVASVLREAARCILVVVTSPSVRPIDFRLRAPCVHCGQPVYADLTHRPERSPARRCSTCGTVQPTVGLAKTSPGVRSGGFAAGVRGKGSRVLAVFGFVLAGTALLAIAVLRSDALDVLRLALRGPVLDHSPRSARLAWAAQPTTVRGIELPSGEPCRVVAEVTTDGEMLERAHLRVTCGAVEVYRGATRDGLACVIEEGPAFGFGLWEYTVTCHQAGDRSGRTMLLDTRAGRLVVRSEQPPLRVEASVRREDGQRAGVPIYGASLGRFYFLGERRFHGRVTAVTGTPPFSRDATCSIRLAPMPRDEQNCRVRVVCDDALVFGGFGRGFVHCSPVRAEPTLAVDAAPSREDGDGEFRLELDGLRAMLGDEDPDWFVTLALQRDEAGVSQRAHHAAP